MNQFKFEKLIVWQKSVEYSLRIHKLTRSFPKEEQYILSSQIKRAADSVGLNIAEGSTGQTNREFTRFLNIALRSNIEVVACLHIGLKREIILQEGFVSNREKAIEISKMISGLKNSLR